MRAFMVGLPIWVESPEFVRLSLRVHQLLSAEYPGDIFWLGGLEEPCGGIVTVHRVQDPEQHLTRLLARVIGDVDTPMHMSVVPDDPEAAAIAQWLSDRFPEMAPSGAVRTTLH